MALSSLQAQLAAINSGGAGGDNTFSSNYHPGSTFTSSKKHGDAIGRGLHHSVHQGFAVGDASSSSHVNSKYKPSIIYETAKKASEIPLKVLQESAINSIETISNDHVPGLSWFGTSSTPYRIICDEKTDMTSQQIQEVLLTISILFRNAECRSDCLNIVEYLLRRYNLHASPGTASSLLWTFLPYIETQPIIFHRIIELIDLTTDQSYVWLRPYCIAAIGSSTQQRNRNKNKNDNGDDASGTTIPKPNIPPRSLIAQHTIRNVSWLRRLVQTTQTVAKRRWYSSSSTTSSPPLPPPPSNGIVERGVQHYLSWSAAIIVQGLSWLSSTTVKTNNKDDREAVVRTVFPVVLSAVSSGGISGSGSSSRRSSSIATTNNEDWVGWGYVVAFTVAERTELAPAAVELIANKILQGVSGSTASSSFPSLLSSRSSTLLDEQADAVIAVLSILIPSTKQLQQQPNPSTYLPLLNGKWLGCPLPDSTFKMLVHNEVFDDRRTLASVMGYLNQTRRIVVAPLIATLFVMGIASLNNTGGAAVQSSEEEEEENHSLCILMKLLIRQGNLKSIWKDSRIDLIASSSSFVLLKGIEAGNLDKSMEGRGKDHVLAYNTILSELHKADLFACERGIAHALQMEKLQHSITNDNMKRKILARLLQGIMNLDLDQDADMLESIDAGNSTNLPLPPRVALEHADPEVRMNALYQLVKHLEDDSNSSGDDEASNETGYVGGESLIESLLRRWSSDDCIQVALASSRALCGKKRGVADLTLDEENFSRLGKVVLSGLYFWIDRVALLQTPSSSDVQELMQNSVIIAGHVANELRSLDDDDASSLFQLIIECLITQLESDDEVIQRLASGSLLSILSGDKMPASMECNDKAEMISNAKSCIIENSRVAETVKALFHSVIGPNPASEMHIRRRCAWMILAEMSDLAADRGELNSQYSPNCLLSLCQLLLNDAKLNSSAISAKELNVIRNGLKYAVKATSYSNIPDVLVSLVGVASDQLLTKAIKPVILSLVASVKDAKGNKVSPTSVLLEAASRFDCPPLASERLLETAAQIIESKEEVSPVLGLIPNLSLLEHPSAFVRAASLKLMQTLQDSVAQHKDWSSLSTICTSINEVKNSISAGTFDLSKFFSSCLQKDQNAAKDLLLLCICSVASAGLFISKLEMNGLSDSWIPFHKASGGNRAVAVVLKGMELAGEALFPLQLRWQMVGKPVLEAFCSIESSQTTHTVLMEVVVGMLKGLKVQDPQIIISSGPKAGGGRARSYSLGRLDGVTVADPYPSDMVEILLYIFSQSTKSSNSGMLAALVVKEVISSQSWRELIFLKLNRKDRLNISSELLSYTAASFDGDSTESFFMLPLQPVDLKDLLDGLGNDVSPLSIMCEYIHSNWSKLATMPGISEVVMKLFKLLATFSSSSSKRDDKLDTEKEFATQSILVSLSHLWKIDADTSSTIKLDKKEKRKCVSTLLSLLGGSNLSRESSPFMKSFQSKSAVLSILPDLCSDYPEITGSLVPIIKSSVEQFSMGTSLPRETYETFHMVVSLFQAHGNALGSSLIHLFTGFIEACLNCERNVTAHLFKKFSRALVSKQTENDAAGYAVASLLVSLLALMANKSGGKPVNAEWLRLVVEIVDNQSPRIQLSCLSKFLDFSIATISMLLDGSPEGQMTLSAVSSSEQTDGIPTPNEIVQLAATGAVSNERHSSSFHGVSKQKQCIINVVNATLQGFCDVMLLDRLQRLIIKSNGGSSGISVRVWQNLLVTNTVMKHSLSSDVKQKNDAQDLSFAVRLLKESQQTLGDILPMHLFLASVSSLLDRDTADVIQVSALQLIAIRANEISNHHSPEVELFIELVPAVSSLLQHKARNLVPEDTSVLQAALLSLTHIAQATNKKITLKTEGGSAAEHFVAALKDCSKLLGSSPSASFEFSTMPPSMHQLLSSTALCIAALVKVLETKCIPWLCVLIKYLVSSLTFANDYMTNSRRDKKDDVLNHVTVFQLSILRALVAIVETVPQVLPSHLPLLLTEKAILCSALQATSSDRVSVARTTDQLRNSLSSRIPPRVLIPATFRAADLCSGCGGLDALLSMMKHSIMQAPSREAASHKDCILKAVFKACNTRNIGGDNSFLLESSKALLLALVMKLSEAQLRKVFTDLLHWRGDLETIDPDPSRRLVFWALAAELSKELGAIFLPCLSTVVNDAKTELHLAASCSSDKWISSSGHKKRRLNSGEKDITCNQPSLQHIRPILQCLELSLKADAHLGGNWIRSDGNQRFETLLDPLGRLLQCHFADPIFQSIIQGLEDGSGSVVNCLTALGLAAGNEQLWKPLNHVVVEACGNERHSDVRKAGLTCLLSLMQSLGEEYMVLLPECLPVLSELLEDQEDGISSLARECVALAEDLIGESLEESLR